MVKNAFKILIIIIIIANVASPTSQNPKFYSEYAYGSSYGLSLAINYVHMAGDSELAAQELSNRLEYSGNDKKLFKSTLLAYLYAGNIDKAIFYAKYYLNLDPNDSIAKLLIVIDNIKKDKFSSTAKEINSLLALEKKNNSLGVDTLALEYLLIWAYVGDDNYQLATKIADNISARGDESGLFYFQRAVLNDLNGDEIKALQYFKKSESLAKVSYNYLDVARNFYLKTKNNSELAKIRNTIDYGSTYLNKYNEVRWQKLDNILEKKKYYAKLMISEIFLDIAKIFAGYNAALPTKIYSHLSLYINDNNIETVITLAQEYESEKKYQQAIDVYNKISKDSDFYDYTQVSANKDNYYLGNKNKAIEQFYKISKQKDLYFHALATLADLYMEDKLYAKATTIYNDLEKAEYKGNKWFIYFLRGICYHNLKQLDKANNDLETALKLYPNQPDLLNYLAYTWLEQNIRIDEARLMVEKALKQRPENAQIIDSMGWVFYRLKDYKKAENYIEKALEALPQDAIINDHLGDIYWQQGRKLEARFQWQKALKYSNNNEDIPTDVLKNKIEKGLL